MTKIYTWLLPIAMLSLSSEAASPTRDARVRRLGLVVGANDGGLGRTPLRYATSDASAVAAVFESLGGVERGDRLLLLEPNRPELERALEVMRGRVSRARETAERVEVVFFYSGHSDEDGLLLGGQRLDYSWLRAAMERLEADVRIAILDSCASGAFTRRKGGRARPPFLADASTSVRGHAFLTASAASEVAQESDRIQASFFTHFLVSGLRGAADTSRDGRVTLIEAYQFAFQETLARTEKTQAGPQHPAYEIQLVGTGDLVMTDLSAPSARLVLPQGVVGRFFIRTDGGRLAAELPSTGGVRELALEPGRYRVTLSAAAGVRETTIELAPGVRYELTHVALSPVPTEVTLSRGAAGQPPSLYRTSPLNLSVVPGLSLNGPADHDLLNYLSLGLLYARSGRVDGVAASALWSWVHGDAYGLVLAPVGSWVGAVMTGVQVGGVVNQAGTLEGIHLAMGANVSRGRARFLQAAGAFNWTNGPVEGLQLAGVANWSGEGVSGAQVALGFNWGGDQSLGVQVAPVNTARDVVGLQLGLVNVARRVRGAQIGLINVADESDVPIGIISVVRDGRHGVSLYATETHWLNASLLFGGKTFYSILALGLQPQVWGLKRFGWGAGFGIHPALSSPWYADVELVAMSLHYADVPFWSEGPSLLFTLRASVGLALSPSISLFAGPSLNAFLSAAEERGDVGRVFAPREPLSRGFARIFPGVALGLQL